MPPAPDPDRALVVANPISGQGKGASVGRELAEGLARRGISAEVHLTQGPGDAQKRVRELGPETDLIISVGGDGTLREVLTGLRDREAGGIVPRARVGLMPMGTGNALGTDFRLPRDVDHALEVITGGNLVEVDQAEVNGTLSFLVTGIGPDALVVKEVDQRRVGGRLSKWHYFPSAVRIFLRYRPVELVVELDDQRLPGSYVQVMASNLIHYGGLVKLAPGRILDDGRFEVFLFRHGDKLHLLGYVLRFFLGWIPGGSVEMKLARRIRVTSASPVPYHVDGDPMGETPVDIEVTGHRFQLLVP